MKPTRATWFTRAAKSAPLLQVAGWLISFSLDKNPLKDYRAFVSAIRAGTLDDTLPDGY
jgi:hypothetical protein